MTTQVFLTAEPSKHGLGSFWHGPAGFLKFGMALVFHSLYFYSLSLVSYKSPDVSATGLSVIFSICFSSSVPCLPPGAPQESPSPLRSEPAGLGPNAVPESCNSSSYCQWWEPVPFLGQPMFLSFSVPPPWPCLSLFKFHSLLLWRRIL